MSGYPLTYPLVSDWTALALGVLPDIAAESPGGDLFVHWTQPLRALDDRLALMYAGAVDLEDAAGWILDWLGSKEGERRNGLADDEYRRLIAGRRVANVSSGSYRSIAAGWRALTGSTVSTVEAEGSSSLFLLARVSYTPSAVWLSRAGRIVRTLIPGGVYATALIEREDTARFDDPIHGFDTGNWAYQLRVNRE